MTDRDLKEMLDRYGADLSSWPDRALAGEAPRRAISDRSFRAALDNAAALEAGLRALRKEMDLDLSVPAKSVAASVLAAVPRQPDGARRWAMVAAAVLVAAALGAIADLSIFAPVGRGSFEVVVLDPLFLDPPGTLSPGRLSP